MWTLLRLVSLRRFAATWLRVLLTVVGIAGGVAVVVAVGAVNESLLEGFRGTLKSVGGDADLAVTGGPGGLDEALVARAQGVPGVRRASATLSLVVRVPRDVPRIGGHDVLLLGVDLAAGDDARDLDAFDAGKLDRAFDPISFLNDPDGLLVSEKLAAALGVAPGERLPLATPSGVVSFRVGGLLHPKGAALAFGGDVAVLDLFNAQRLFRREGRVERIDVSAAPGVTVDALKARLAAALGPGAAVDRPARKGDSTERMLRSFQVGLGMGSVVALLVGMFLVYNTVAFSVVQRRREIGTLRALGVEQRAIRLMFAGEAAVLGAVGSVLGVGLGALLARAAVRMSTAAVGEIYGRISSGETIVTWRSLVAGLTLGVVAATVAALRPAAEAARVPPIEALRRDRVAGSDAAGDVGDLARLVRGALIGSLAIPLLALPSIGGAPVFGYAALLAVTLGGASLARLAVKLVRLTLGRLAARVFGPAGRLAADGLARAPARSAVAAAAVMIGLALAVCTGGWTNSFEVAMMGWVSRAVPADVFVIPSAQLAGATNTAIDPAVGDALAALPGVAAVDKIRLAYHDWNGLRTLLLSLGPDVYFKYAHPTFLSGTAEVAVPEVKRGAVLVSENMMRRFGLERGGKLTLDTAHGPKTYDVAGVIVDYSTDQGLVAMDHENYAKDFDDVLVDSFDVYVKPGVDAAGVRGEILRRFGAKYDLYALLNAELRAHVVKTLDAFFAMTYALLLVALAVALLGIASTLLAQVVERTRELGILRALGASRRQIVGAVALEAGLLGSAGALLGLPVGVLLAAVFVRILGLKAVGWSIPLVVPWGLLAVGTLAAIASAVAAGLPPARRAAALDVVDAISYE